MGIRIRAGRSKDRNAERCIVGEDLAWAQVYSCEREKVGVSETSLGH